MTAAFLSEWLNLLVRWAHLVVGVAWIGTSFYFIALDLALRPRGDDRAGVAGSAWEVHGGGFYRVEKYLSAPQELPPDLIWYKWEAYLTWLTGFSLLILQYYLNAEAYLIDPSKRALTPLAAIGLSIGSLAAGWLLYSALCRSPLGRRPDLLASAVFVLIVAFAYGYGHLFSGRGALIHVGVLIGTIMAFNVSMVIIPNQRKIVASLITGALPDPMLGRISKQRSVHNNYLTLPVLVLMVSSHYPMLTGHPHAWLLVALVIVLGAAVRHFLNRHDAGDPLRTFAWTLPVAALALVLAVGFSAPQPIAVSVASVSDTEALRIASTHCATCHALAPTHEGFDAPPGGVVLETLEDLRRYAAQIVAQAVQTHAMPLGNETAMSDAERQALGAWLEGER